MRGQVDRRALIGLVEIATRAPSSHNTQPWRFEISETGIRLFADRRRSLPCNDPEGRELTISCGAALLTMRVAAASAGLTPTVQLIPGPDGDLLADVALTPVGAGEDVRSDAALSDAIGRRRTWRRRFAEEPLPGGLVPDLTAACAAEGAWLHIVAAEHHDGVARLVAEGDRIQFGDREWRRELASWMRTRGAGDGLPRGPLTRRVVRTVDVGRTTARTDARLARAAPLLAVIGTDRDRPLSWLAAGQALQRLLLVAADVGVQAGFLNQPCQVAALRPRLAELLGGPGAPQLLVRLGIPPRPAAATPRRPPREVLSAHL